MKKLLCFVVVRSLFNFLIGFFSQLGSFFHFLFLFWGPIFAADYLADYPADFRGAVVLVTLHYTR